MLLIGSLRNEIWKSIVSDVITASHLGAGAAGGREGPERGGLPGFGERPGGPVFSRSRQGFP
ncbi:MAG: hypothetical protein JWL86_2290 [Rhizobium sp.]|nr:hypothetical protein [Rhizobium sp.]